MHLQGPILTYCSVIYCNVLPVITKPTRLTDSITQLHYTIDHIYTNDFSKIFSGIITVDISDHFQSFVLQIPVYQFTKEQNLNRYCRNYINFNQESYLQDTKLMQSTEMLMTVNVKICMR